MRAPEARADVFPSTASTWLSRCLDGEEGGVEAANRHIMDVYAQPLRVYYLGSSFRTLGEPEDLVGGFFADRLSRKEFLSRWHLSGRPLRHWLIVGFKHFLYEEGRRRRGKGEGSFDEEMQRAGEDEPTRDWDRAIARSLVQEATRRAAASCVSEGLDRHWGLFVAHHVDGEGFREIGARLGESPERCAVMARTAANRFRRALRDIVGWRGASESDVDSEIGLLMEALQS